MTRAQELRTAIANTSEWHDLYENPDEMCRAIVEQLGITRHQVEVIDRNQRMLRVEAGAHEVDEMREAADALATILDAAGVEP